MATSVIATRPGTAPAAQDNLSDTTMPKSWVQVAKAVMRDSERDYFQVNGFWFWTHSIISVVLAYSAASLYLISETLWIKALAFPFAVFWLYRVGSFVHEVCHLQKSELRAFKVFWNLVVGVPTLTPSTFFTQQHRDHHSQKMYGSPQDPEYVVNCCEPGRFSSLMSYLFRIALFPLFVFFRFFLTPLTFLHPKLRRWVLERQSTFTFNTNYVRDINGIDNRTFIPMEILCWLRSCIIPAGVILGLATDGAMGTHWTRMPQLYLLGFTVVLINMTRQLADHHFDSEGSIADFEAHVVDSCNFTSGDPVTRLFFPFAIRYHALHHLFPSLPYHNLAAAHEYLLQELPSDSPYRKLDQGTWWSVARETLRLRATPARKAAMDQAG